MLLHDDHDASSPSRNSSPDVVLMVANPDVERVERGTSPHRPDAGRIDRGTSPQQPGSTGVLLTPHINNFSDDDAEDYAKFKERERTRRPSPERASRNTPRHESSDDRNQSSLGPLPVGVSPPSEGTRPSGVAGPSGFRARTAAQLPSHGEAEPIPVLSETAPAPVPTSGSIPSSMGGPTPRTDPHAGELERHADALLQRNTISADNPGMNIATYLDDWLVPVSRSGRLPSKPTRTQPPGTPIMTGDPEPSSSTLTSSPNMSTESSFQLSSLEENWETSNQAEPTLSELSLGTYHVPENIPRLYQIQEGFRVRSWSALHRDNERFLQRIAIPRLPPLTGYEVFPYPKEIPTRRNRPSIEEMREGEVGETRQPSDAEQLLAGVFDTGLDRLLLVLNFVRTKERITEVAAELAALIRRLEEIALGLDPSSMHGML
ncbi:hypothetical protein HETIRDRAFT_171160 [Heterobasidion irregulare TC 32-1]|uniref:Uncharacterized protein n=1 Tax=Heterobasidion irregulare (strain TC 32-1) TaxID=747525 RepID=W4KHV1_HETIT|nr:uncharacterized protein HETIRDRAFT_171160 [Heterobasidion irregulare TC 32-1]ETW84656.1 hypothetical protein HETIRDRAFT_171160 [Heterobasidion irregulare TC 32-1]